MRSIPSSQNLITAHLTFKESDATILAMPSNQLFNGCYLPETLSLYTQLRAFSDVALDMVVIEEPEYKEVVRCVFDLNGLKAGLEIDSISGECEVYGFVRKAGVCTSPSSTGAESEAICKIGSSHQALILDYLESKNSKSANFKDFYQPNATGLGEIINMSIHT